MTVAIITARGGSTRVPRKNIAMVGGKPLVAWSIIQALNSKLIDRVYLTTDDDEIAAIGAEYGAEIIRRPVWDNGVTGGMSFYDALQKVEAQSVFPDALVTMLPTACLRKPDELDRLVRAHMETGYTVTTACPQKETYIFHNDRPYQDRFETLPENDYYKAHQLTGDKFWNYSKMAGGVSCGSRDELADIWSKSARMDIELDTAPINTGLQWVFVPVEEWQTFDVDYPADLELVRVLFAHYILAEGGEMWYNQYKAGV